MSSNGTPVYPVADGSRGAPVVWIDPTTDLPVVPTALVTSQIAAAIAVLDLSDAITAQVAAAMASAVAMLPTTTQLDAIQYLVPTTGQTVAAAVGKTLMALNHALPIAVLNVSMPANPVDGQRWALASASAVTLLNLTGGTIKGAITSLLVNSYARFTYSVAAAAWFRIG